MRLLVAALALASGTAIAQYRGPAVDACLAQAKRQQEGTAQIVLERDASLQIARGARKAGSQAVSAVLTGNGAVVFPESPSAELSFLCLLADEKRAVFFSWLPRSTPSALASCARSAELRARLRPCLESLQQMAEQELLLVYAQHFQQANERGAATVAAFRKSNDAWRAYRDAECARRREQPREGTAAEDLELACLVELTRRRAAEMR
jgi:uncharacterized protein YecT (DUF1311 family)